MDCISVVRMDSVSKISLIARVFFALACFFVFSLPASAQIVNIAVMEQFRTRNQHFSCTAEYAPAKCVRDLQRLHRLLEQYKADGLGEWQWVVVSRSEWKPFCVRLGVDFLSPAMTSFLDRQAFFDEALFDADPSRSAELVRKFGTTWKELLPLAVTHELGHAVCRDAAEARAEFLPRNFASTGPDAVFRRQRCRFGVIERFLQAGKSSAVVRTAGSRQLAGLLF